MSTNPNVTLSDVRYQASNIFVAVVKSIVFGPRGKPLIVGDVPPCNTDTCEPDVSDIVDNLNNRIICRGGCFPFSIDGKTAFVNEAYAAKRASEHSCAVYADCICSPVWHTIVNIETIVDCAAARGITTDTDVGSCIHPVAIEFKIKVLGRTASPVVSYCCKLTH